MSNFLKDLPTKTKFRKIVKTALDDLRRGKPTSLEPLTLLALQPTTSLAQAKPFSARLLTFLKQTTVQQLKTLDKQFLEERFWNDLPVVEFAEQYDIERRRAYESLNQAIANLSDRLWEKEDALRAAKRAAQHNQLAAPNYTALIGVDALFTQTLTGLLQPDAPHVLCLYGLGGIGKTSLADKVTRAVIEKTVYHDVFWIRVDEHVDLKTLKLLLTDATARLGGRKWAHQHLTTRWQRLQAMFKERAYLVVIDNVEENVHFGDLIAFVDELVGPSKVLLTSRAYPTQFAEHGYQKISLDELPLSAAQEILQHYATVAAVPGLVDTVSAHQDDICAKLGGNPYALRLFVSMLSAGVTIESALQSLPTLQHEDTYRIYTRIFYKLWNEILTPSAKQVLQVMTSFAEHGATAAEIEQHSQLTNPMLGNVIGELRRFALLEQRGQHTADRYGIHRITNTFLLSEIFKWPTYTALKADTQAQADLIQSLQFSIKLWHLRIGREQGADESDLEHLRTVSKLGLAHQQLADKVSKLIQQSFHQIWSTAQMQKWLSLLEQATAITVDPVAKAALLRQVAYYLREKGDLQQSVNKFSDCWALLETLPISETHGACLIGWGETMRRQGENAEAMSRFEEALQIAERLSDAQLDAVAKTHIGLTLTDMHQKEAGIAYLQDALSYFETVQQLNPCITVLHNIAGAYFDLKQYTDAHRYYEIVVAYTDRPTLAKRSELLIIYGKAHLYYIDGNHQAAIELLSDTIQNNSALKEYADIYTFFQELVSNISRDLEDGVYLLG